LRWHKFSVNWPNGRLTAYYAYTVDSIKELAWSSFPLNELVKSL
jgi:hypothetical protein